MTGYNQVLQVMASMLIFGLVVLQTNRQIVLNTQIQLQGELEQEVIALATDIIDEALASHFDENTLNGNIPVFIPEGFTDPGIDAGEDVADRTTFDDFDDYHNWHQIIPTEVGEFMVSGKVIYIDPITEEPSLTPTTAKRLEVTIQSRYLRQPGSTELRKYQFNSIRSYFAD